MVKNKDVLNKKEQIEMSNIEQTFYMKPPISKIDEFVSTSKLSSHKSILESLNHIERFMQESKDAVGELQIARKERGEVKDLSQSGKSIAGAMFAKLLHYILLMNKEKGNIPPNIFITRSKKEIEKKCGEDFKIYIEGETQTPDCDMMIYNNDNGKIIILSLKTSLRERAGQTFKWKLLWEIATSSNTELKDKLDISYKGTMMPKICFATADFYDEINSPQHRGMYKFFDNSFISRPNFKHDLVSNLSDLPNFIESTICQ